jgi:hypothetical protein
VPSGIAQAGAASCSIIASTMTMAAALRTIITEAPELLHQAPHTLPISRPNEVQAARQPIHRWPTCVRD